MCTRRRVQSPYLSVKTFKRSAIDSSQRRATSRILPVDSCQRVESLRFLGINNCQKVKNLRIQRIDNCQRVESSSFRGFDNCQRAENWRMHTSDSCQCPFHFLRRREVKAKRQFKANIFAVLLRSEGQSIERLGTKSFILNT